MDKPEEKLELQIRVSVSQRNYSGGRIELSDTLYLDSKNFIELCRILAQFDELARKIGSEK